jgi:hypothetical protein
LEGGTNNYISIASLTRGDKMVSIHNIADFRSERYLEKDEGDSPHIRIDTM